MGGDHGAQDVSQPDYAKQVVNSQFQMPSGLAAPGRHLVPHVPFCGCVSFQSWPSLVMNLLVGVSSSHRRRLLLAHFLHEACVPPSPVLHPPHLEALIAMKSPFSSVCSCRASWGFGCGPCPAEMPAEPCLSPCAQDHRIHQRLPADHPGEGSQHWCL